MNREEYNAYMRDWYHKNKDKVKPTKKKYYLDNNEYFMEKQRRYRRDNKEKVNSSNRKYGWKVKLEVLSYYSEGTFKCVHCGEDDLRFLQIDHIEGGGNEHRKSIGGGGSTLYYWLKKQGFPEGYQVLCANCNIRKDYEMRNLHAGEV